MTDEFVDFGRVPTEEEARLLHEELQKELREGHPLYEKSVKVVAINGDDILCQHLDEEDRFTSVHLTWKGAQERPKFPWVNATGTFQDCLDHD